MRRAAALVLVVVPAMSLAIGRRRDRRKVRLAKVESFDEWWHINYVG